MTTKKNIGKVTSNRMNKTIVVAVTRKILHKKYGKVIIKTNKYYAHDEENKCKIGDIVKIQETRPISKNKCWKLIHTIGK